MNLDAARHALPIDVESCGEFAAALVTGLSAHQKFIPCRFFYDAAGSALFERITELPEYYPTRTEMRILREYAADMAALASPGAVLIEFGSGSSLKTELLLAEMQALHAYVPIDISGAALGAAQARIATRFPALHVLPVAGDFSQPLRLPKEIAARPRLGFFPGSTIGNLIEDEAVELMANMREILGEDGTLIIGADLKKDVRRLIAAYDDAAGVTAAFNLNLLHRANRELGADFSVDAFAHLATYDVRHGRIDMHLVSRTEQIVHVLGHRFRFFTGERIHTEHSHKYDIEGFRALARRAGWRPGAVWTDAEALFSVHVLAAA
ncbi:MAG: L-histidine N(alpha)-methyltransferase [Hyphomicrobium sp.]|uniref:L-histidine N(alpha)-methyltransferase n=1 Tax=Hyphomicrobium sp. TaxID=82 RepID=UPI00132144B4|nr:L-histidine N(alpha)-methyltransferase [Hyphomicrobium sp.]KAB2942352.1 MAG: L-histidine N(alpha)-methyltransferase [Hyphomicrobium sp.]MBZ0212121.1 L-histidine N(alpha)-methyltransferase [Hyphomicrobium sp.]